VLPVEALQSAQAYSATFESLGARSVADLLALPRDGMKRRFGDFLLDEIDRAFGHVPDPLRPVTLPAAFSTTLPLPAPAESSTTIIYASGRGLRQLEGFLRAGKHAVDRIELTLHHERQSRHDSPDNVTPLTLHLMQPSADARRFILLLTEHLNRHTLKRRVERITIAAPQLLRADEITHSLLLEEEDAAKSMRDLLERVHARLGPEAVRQLQVKAEHRPERASGDTALLNTSHKPAAAIKKPKEPLPPPVFGPRPAWFIDPPLPLDAIGPNPIYEGKLDLQEPPEHIESGWWDSKPIQREYFVARTEEGRLLWIFRDERRENRWFLQGYFS
jgi:protein ImuB